MSAGRAARTATAISAAVILAAAVAACGSSPARSPQTAGQGVPAAITGPALATSLAGPGGTDWAVVEMGGSAAQHNNFWELFARTAACRWTLATPPGVATNGGLVAAITGTGSLLAAFRPSQDLTFSPLATTPDAGVHWSDGTLLSAGVADEPGALAGSSGKLLALTDSASVEISSGQGAAWTRLATLRALSQTAAGRGCGLASLTATAWTPAGQPLVAGDCSKPGRAGILTLSGGNWRLAAPALPAALARDRVSVIGLATAGQHTTAVLAASSGAATVIIAAWSADGGANWTVSPALAAHGSAGGIYAPSVAFGPDDSVSLVLPPGPGRGQHGSTGATLAWQASQWQVLPALPAGTATLAATATGPPEALAARRGTLTVWKLASAGAKTWTTAQTVRVPVPYGSSG